MSAHGPPCPTCERPLTKRHLQHQAWLARRARMGPNRQAALDDSKDGFCVECDMPIPLTKRGKRKHMYTCDRKACRKVWKDLWWLDRLQGRKQERSAAHG